MVILFLAQLIIKVMFWFIPLLTGSVMYNYILGIIIIIIIIKIIIFDVYVLVYYSIIIMFCYVL